MVKHAKGSSSASAFGVERNGDTTAARHRVYFGKGFSSTSGRQLGAGKLIWGRSLVKGGWRAVKGSRAGEVGGPRAGATEWLAFSRAGVGMPGKEGL